MTILVVDDNETNLYQLQVLLGASGYQVVTAANGAEALDKARQSAPDLVITDILMPVMDGFTLCREWKQDERLTHIPLVFYTATYTDARDEELALGLGAARFIIKPQDPGDFLEAIRDVIETHERGGLMAPRPPVRDEAVLLKEYNEALIRKLEDKMAQLEHANRELERDMAERKRAEEALRENEARYRRLFENLREMVTVYEVGRDSDGRIIERRLRDANSAFVRAVGVSSIEEIRGKTSSEVFGKAWSEFHLTAIQEAMDTGEVRTQEVHHHESGRHYITAIVPLDANTYLGTGWDITARKRAEAALWAHRELLETVVNHIPAAVSLIRGSDLRLQLANPAYQAIAPGKEMVGKTLDELWPETGQNFSAVCRRVLETGEPYRTEDDLNMVQRGSDGRLEPAYFSWSLHRVRLPGDEGWGLLNAAWETTERKQAEEQLRQSAAELQAANLSLRESRRAALNLMEDALTARQRAEQASAGLRQEIVERKRAEEALKEADRRKDEFLAMLAHELRNPLAPIRNAAHLLRLVGSAEPRLAQARDLIDRQVTHMVRLIDDLLDVSRITRGKVTLRKERVDLAAVVAQALEAVRPLITRKRQAFTMSCAPEPIEVEADPARLVQVGANLLSNAAKFTEPGGSITLSTERNGDEAVIRVRDTGVGIAPELLPRIFDLFVQGETSLDRTEGGLGIGLTLVRHVVEQHGGRVEARSAGRGSGSEFVVTLPAAAVPMSVSAPTSAVESAAPGRRLRILVVEDNLDAAESFITLLELQGHQVRAAYTGPAALEAAKSFVPDVAFIDLGLPGLDGYEVARRLRAIPSFQATVLVALTGYGQEEHKQRAQAAGFDYHLTKPVDPSAIDRLLVDVAKPASQLR